jgi:hypothetical protein
MPMPRSIDRQKSVSDYVAELCAELIVMAESANLPMLAYLLDMARIEAEATSKRILAHERGRAGRPAEDL